MKPEIKCEECGAPVIRDDGELRGTDYFNDFEGNRYATLFVFYRCSKPNIYHCWGKYRTLVVRLTRKAEATA